MADTKPILRTFMNRLVPIIVSLVILASCESGRTIRVTQLDEVLRLKGTYEKSFLDKVGALKNMRTPGMPYNEEYRLNRKIADEYSSFSFDSTMAYLERNVILTINNDDEVRLTETDLLRAREYSKAGYHVEASNLLQAVRPVWVTPELKPLWFSVRHSLAGEMMSYSGGLDLYEVKFSERNELRDSLMKYIEPGSYDWYYLNREAALSAKDSVSVLELTEKMLSQTEEYSREYAAACWYYAEGISPRDRDLKLEWLCKAAITDVMCATKDYAALNEVACILFRNGDINRAFRYVADYSLPDALAFNGKLRPWQISRFFPMIERAYEERLAGQKRHMVASVAVVSLLFVVLAFLLLALSRHHKSLEKTNERLRSLNARLEESDKVKEEYIALFLEKVSDNINKDRKNQNHLLKYLRRGDYKYLLDEIESLPPIEDDIRQFYKMFDEAFLNLYPDFVEQVNTLLAPEEKITLKDGDLTPELRICALIRLGVTDSGKMASLLHYSANTVYNYRARIRNKAIGPRDKFEEEVKRLSLFPARKR